MENDDQLLSDDQTAIAVIIPLYNHAATLAAVVDGVLAYGLPVIVVDDGSRDGATTVLGHLPEEVEIIRHEENLGKGRAILSGAQRAQELGCSHIVTIDADGQHAPEDLTGFMGAISENPSAIIVGCRDFENTYVPGSSRFGRSFSNFWFRVQTGRRIGDSQSGFRAYPLTVIKAQSWREPRYAFENEILVKSAWAGITIREIPIQVHYPPPDEHISHFHRLWDNLRLSLLNTRLTMRSMLPWPHSQLDEQGEIPEPVSILHPVRSLKLLLKENADPGRLAWAVALGTFIGVTPLLGLRGMLVLIGCGFFRLNKVVALGAGNVGMPPLMPALCIEAGFFLRHGHFLTEISLKTLGYQALERFWEWCLGALVLAPTLALILGLTTWLTARSLKKARATAVPATSTAEGKSGS